MTTRLCISSGNTGTSMYYSMVALADWSQRIFPTNNLSIENTFQCLWDTLNFSCPTYCPPRWQIIDFSLKDMTSMMRSTQLLVSLIPISRLRGPIRRCDALSSLCDKWLRRYWTGLVEPWMMGRVYKVSAYLHRPSFWLNDWT